MCQPEGWPSVIAVELGWVPEQLFGFVIEIGVEFVFELFEFVSVLEFVFELVFEFASAPAVARTP